MTGSIYLTAPPDGVSAVAPFSAPVAVNYIGNVSGLFANSALTLNLTPPAGKTAYVTGFEVSSFGATSALIALVKITGIIGSGNEFQFYLSVPAGATLPCTPFPLSMQFNVPLKANTMGGSISLIIPALGAGHTNLTANIRGFWV